MTDSEQTANSPSASSGNTKQAIVTGLIIVLVAVAVLGVAFYSLFLTKPGTEHNSLVVIAFVWGLLPAVCVAGNLAFKKLTG